MAVSIRNNFVECVNFKLRNYSNYHYLFLLNMFHVTVHNNNLKREESFSLGTVKISLQTE